MKPITLVVEGRVDQAVAEILAHGAGFEVQATHVKSGKSQLNIRLPGYNAAARFGPWFVLRDLDMDSPCAGDLVKKLLPNPSDQMCFRVAVHTVESWLISDRERFISFFHLPAETQIESCDSIANPKQFVLTLLGRSRSRAIREDMLARSGSGGREGPAYASQMAQYARDAWRASAAARRSDSLRRAIAALRMLRANLH